MKKYLLLILSTALMACLIACQSKTEPQAKEPLVIKHNTLERANMDVGKQAKRRLVLKLSFPYVESGSDQAKDSISYFVRSFMRNLVGSNEMPTNTDSIFQYMVKTHRESYARDTFTKDWDIEMRDFIWQNTTKVVTIRLDGYTNTGGAHPNAVAAIGNFNPVTGHQIALEELTTDRTALQSLLETKYRALKESAFAGGFNFSNEFPFRLPNHFGFTNEGMLFHYNTYEVGPYVLGDADITIPYPELEKIMNLAKYR